MPNARIGGIELGGTKAIALVGRDGVVEQRLSIPTGRNPQQTLGALADWLDRAAPLDAIGIASFGPVSIDPKNSDYGKVRTTPKPGWAGTDLLTPFANRFACPIAIDTDVNAAALAEQRWGAARGCNTLAYITIGTGVGVGIVAGNAPIHGRLHPEAGHLLFRREQGDDFPGTCSFHGDCVEGLISGPALAARFNQPPATIDPANPLWRIPGGDLARLLASLIYTVAPQRILIGGGVGIGCPSLLDHALSALTALLSGYFLDLDELALRDLIRPAALGSDAGPLGAVALGLRALGP